MEKSMGTWRPDASRCEFLVESARNAGAPEEVCTIEKLSETRITVSRDGDTMTIKNSYPGVPEQVINFKTGQEFELDSPKGKVKYTVTEETNRVVENVVLPSGDKMTTVREMENDDMKVTITAFGKTFTQYWVKA